MKYYCKYKVKDSIRFEGKEDELFTNPAIAELERVTEGKNVIDKKVFRKPTSDSTIVTHQWETHEWETDEDG